MESTLVIPIPHYPPFKLRSSLIDKDPVIWVHLLEAYIRLFKFLLSQESNGSKILSVKTQQQLQLFLKVFLYETSQEATQIFSLGAINPDIKDNTYQLKVLVFQYLRNFSLVKLSLTGEAVWKFASIYIVANPDTVRGLIDGSYKSKYNDNKKSGNLSCIGIVQKHIQETVLQGKFTSNDLANLSSLLGQHTSVTQTISLTSGGLSKNSAPTVNTKGSSALGFSESFVDPNWIEMLERLYSGGKGISANTSKNLMVVSLLALSVSKIAKLAMDLRITNVRSLLICPLFSCVILSEPFQLLIPGLEERLQFLRKISFKSSTIDDSAELPTDDQIFFLQEIFPTLSKPKAITILLENSNNVESVTSLLLEDPEIIDSIEDYAPDVQRDRKKPSQALIDRFTNIGFNRDTIVHKKHKSVNLSENNTKEKTLSAALRLMYESDEDEPDDTYDDQIATVGSAGIDEDKSSNKKGTHLTSKLAVLDDEPRDGRELSPVPRATEISGMSKSRESSAISDRERFLFSEYKSVGGAIFSRDQRKNPARAILKRESGWTHEQIEGWFRMIQKSPRLYKILDEDFFGRGNPNRPRVRNAPNSENPANSEPQTKQEKAASLEPKTKAQEKKSNARNEKNKASKANHNRKAASNKKSKANLLGIQ